MRVEAVLRGDSQADSERPTDAPAAKFVPGAAIVALQHQQEAIVMFESSRKRPLMLAPTAVAGWVLVSGKVYRAQFSGAHNSR